MKNKLKFIILFVIICIVGGIIGFGWGYSIFYLFGGL